MLFSKQADSKLSVKNNSRALPWCTLAEGEQVELFNKPLLLSLALKKVPNSRDLKPYVTDFQSAVSKTVWQQKLKLRGTEGEILLLFEGIVTLRWECLLSAGGTVSGSLEEGEVSSVLVIIRLLSN